MRRDYLGKLVYRSLPSCSRPASPAGTCRLAMPLLLAAALGACSSRPDLAEIFVKTDPAGATCQLARGGQLIGTVEPTPGIALVSKVPQDITIVCRRAGFAPATRVAHAHDATPDIEDMFDGKSGITYDDAFSIAFDPAR